MSIKKQIFTSHLRAKPDFMLYNREAPKNFGAERVDSKRLKKGCAKAKNRSVRQAWVQRRRGWTRRQRAQRSSNGCGSRCSHVAVDKKPPRRHARLPRQNCRGRAGGRRAHSPWGPLTQPLGSRQKQRTESREDTETWVTNPTGTCWTLHPEDWPDSPINKSSSSFFWGAKC